MASLQFDLCDAIVTGLQAAAQAGTFSTRPVDVRWDLEPVEPLERFETLAVRVVPREREKAVEGGSRSARRKDYLTDLGIFQQVPDHSREKAKRLGALVEEIDDWLFDTPLEAGGRRLVCVRVATPAIYDPDAWTQKYLFAAFLRAQHVVIE